MAFLKLSKAFWPLKPPDIYPKTDYFNTTDILSRFWDPRVMILLVDSSSDANLPHVYLCVIFRPVANSWSYPAGGCYTRFTFRSSSTATLLWWARVTCIRILLLVVTEPRVVKVLVFLPTPVEKCIWYQWTNKKQISGGTIFIGTFNMSQPIDKVTVVIALPQPGEHYYFASVNVFTVYFCWKNVKNYRKSITTINFMYLVVNNLLLAGNWRLVILSDYKNTYHSTYSKRNPFIY